VIRFFRASCFAFLLAILFPLLVHAIRQATVLSHPASPDALSLSLKFFQASFIVLAVGAPAAYVCMLFSGVSLLGRTLWEMPLLRAGALLLISPVLLRLFVFLVDKVLPGYGQGAQGMGTLVGFLTPVLLGGGGVACVAAFVSYFLAKARSKQSSAA
jgi:hypothetical protein